MSEYLNTNTKQRITNRTRKVNLESKPLTFSPSFKCVNNLTKGSTFNVVQRPRKRPRKTHGQPKSQTSRTRSIGPRFPKTSKLQTKRSYNTQDTSQSCPTRFGLDRTAGSPTIARSDGFRFKTLILVNRNNRDSDSRSVNSYMLLVTQGVIYGNTDPIQRSEPIEPG